MRYSCIHGHLKLPFCTDRAMGHSPIHWRHYYSTKDIKSLQSLRLYHSRGSVAVRRICAYSYPSMHNARKVLSFALAYYYWSWGRLASPTMSVTLNLIMKCQDGKEICTWPVSYMQCARTMNVQTTAMLVRRSKPSHTHPSDCLPFEWYISLSTFPHEMWSSVNDRSPWGPGDNMCWPGHVTAMFKHAMNRPLAI